MCPESQSERAVEFERLRQEVVALRKERDDVAIANAHAALSMAQMFERRERELEEQSRALEEALGNSREAAKKKDEFLAKISHELRTPLNGIIVAAQLLVDSLRDPIERENATVALVSARSLLEIVNDLLDFSKAQVGKMELRDEALDAWALCGDVTKLLSGRASGSRVRLECVVDPGTPRRIRGDAVRLRQILINLCGNALKFTEEGRVVLRCHLDADDSRILVFSVADTGCGVPQESLEEIFEAFHQLDNSNARCHGGTGLGLAICKALASSMGGGISVESVLGQGSTFTVRLPLRAEIGTLPPPRYRRVMLFGDALESSESVAAHLKALGVERVAASSGPRLAIGPDELALIEVEAELGESVEALTKRLQHQGAKVGWVLRAARDDSRVMHGVVSLFLPLCAHELVDLLTGQASAAVPAALPRKVTSSRDKRLLVVEDNALNQLVARRLLERLGFAVEVAGSGAEALERVAEDHFDAVLMDCQMPEMDGYETTRRIRAMGHSALPIIALTANAMGSDRERCHASGMDGFVSKLIVVDELLAVLARFVGNSGSTTEAG